MTGYDCYCEYTDWEFFDCRDVKARVSHRCFECRGTIEPGETYEYAVGKTEGEIYVHKTCGFCCAARRYVAISLPCYCWTYGNFESDARVALMEALERAPEEMAGVMFAFGRLIVARNRHNDARKRDQLDGEAYRVD